jgi:site-specific DNA-methyltransferase (adenine-specific)
MPPQLGAENTLYYGDNLDVLRQSKYFKDESVDLCYIDPPFNSKRNYNQIYNNIGTEDRAQAQAFVDTWVWDLHANKGLEEILGNEGNRFTRQTIELIQGLRGVLGQGSLLAYLVSMALRITEIHRILKPAGSFYLHCDPSAGHYLKLVLDSVFLSQGGDFRNEIVWCYTGPGSPGMRQFMRKHDTIFWYSKSDTWTFNADEVRIAHSSKTRANYKEGLVGSGFVGADHLIHERGKVPEDWWQIAIAPRGKEYLGYPTQKPEALLERIIRASSNTGDVVLDAYCGCGTTITVAQRLNRRWRGIDITYQSIALVLRRLEQQFGKDVAQSVLLDGIPSDMASATALAHKRDDRLRKEFEKWAILTYTNNRAIINDKKGGDGGIDGIAFFLTGANDNAKVVFQVKSGNVGRGEVSKLNNDRARAGAELAVFLTLEPPTRGMREEANAAGMYEHKLMGRSYPRIQIVTIQEIVEQHKRLDIPMSLEVLKTARAVAPGEQSPLPLHWQQPEEEPQ